MTELVKPRRRELPAVAQVAPPAEEEGEPVGIKGNGNGHLVQK